MSALPMSGCRAKTAASRSASAERIRDLRIMIEAIRFAVTVTVNAGLTAFYRRIGDRINQEILRGRRADDGRQILAALSQQLGWSHFRDLLPFEKPLRREFYAEMCRVEQWSVHTPRQKIASMLYE